MALQCGMEGACGLGCSHALGGFGWVFQVAILVLLLLIFWWLFRGQGFGFLKGKETPEEIVKRRLASGEITKKEYDKLLKELK